MQERRATQTTTPRPGSRTQENRTRAVRNNPRCHPAVPGSPMESLSLSELDFRFFLAGSKLAGCSPLHAPDVENIPMDRNVRGRRSRAGLRSKFQSSTTTPVCIFHCDWVRLRGSLSVIGFCCDGPKGARSKALEVLQASQCQALQRGADMISGGSPTKSKTRRNLGVSTKWLLGAFLGSQISSTY